MLLALLLACAGPTGPASEPAGFGFPLVERERFLPPYIGYDHDPVVHGPPGERILCTTYDGATFPRCYDEHTGTDYLLAGGFESMDAGSSPVVAAADGVVAEAEDGQYDRCHLEGADVTCDGHPIIANRVVLEHADGTRSGYWHLAQGSVAVALGDRVACGDRLGLVGSSGVSSAPHLHFQVWDDEGRAVDPYAGERSQPESYWAGQNDPDELPDAGCAAP
jgi:murein DD-endopeptidase MepM/ murein hydrolase activator NlpD